MPRAACPILCLRREGASPTLFAPASRSDAAITRLSFRSKLNLLVVGELNPSKGSNARYPCVELVCLRHPWEVKPQGETRVRQDEQEGRAQDASVEISCGALRLIRAVGCAPSCRGPIPYGFACAYRGGDAPCAVRTGSRHDAVPPPPQRTRAQHCCAHGSVAGESAALALTCSYYDKQQLYGGGLLGQRRDQHDERRVVNERHAALVQVITQSSCDEWTQVQPRAHTRASGPNSCG